MKQPDFARASEEKVLNINECNNYHFRPDLKAKEIYGAQIHGNQNQKCLPNLPKTRSVKSWTGLTAMVPAPQSPLVPSPPTIDATCFVTFSQLVLELFGIVSPNSMSIGNGAGVPPTC
ncbi:unnamed protein product [Natator depressus]